MIRAAWIALGVTLLLLAIFGGLAFFIAPAYEKGAWAVITVLTATITAILGFLFGAHVPKAEEPQQVTNASQN